jgi:phosphotransferase system enzyme I (PtsI)
VEEVRQAKAILDEVRAGLAADGVPFDAHLPVGVMIETPAAVMVADALAREVDFFSIGTNDLIQYALAVDRRNGDVAYLYQPCAPAVLRLIAEAMRAAHEAGKPVSVCGEMAADPFHVPLLLGLGVRTLSMNAHAIPVVKRMVRRASAADCAALVASVRTLGTTAEVEAELGRYAERCAVAR